MQYLKKIKILDLFGSNLQLLSNGQTTYQTYYGAVGSILIITCFVIVFIGNVLGFFRLEFLQYKTFSLVQIDQNITLDQQSFKFAISISNYDLQSQQLFTIYAQQFSRFINETSINYEPILLEKCKIQDWSNYGKTFQNYYKSNNMNDYFCSPLKFQLNLAGQFGSDVFNYIKIAIKPCPANNCTNAVNEFIQRNRYVQYNIIYLNKAINYSNTFQPFYNYPDRSFYRFVPNNVFVSVDQYIMPQNVQTDISVFPFKNIKTISSYEVTSQNFITSVPFNVKDKQYFRHFLRVSPKKLYVQRKVQSLNDFLSFLGGIFSIFHIIGALILTPFAQFKFKMKVFNSSYFIKNKKNIKINDLQSPTHQDFNFFKFLFFKTLKYIQPLLSDDIFDCKTYKICQQIAQENLDIIKIIQKLNFIKKSIDYLLDQHQISMIKKLKYQSLQLDSKEQQREQSLQELWKQFSKKKPKQKVMLMQKLVDKLKGQERQMQNQDTQRKMT